MCINKRVIINHLKLFLKRITIRFKIKQIKMPKQFNISIKSKVKEEKKPKQIIQANKQPIIQQSNYEIIEICNYKLLFKNILK